MEKRMLRRRVAGLALALVVAGVPMVVGAPRAEAAGPPTPTAQRAGKPTSVAAVGDSITQATGTGALSSENPKNSWATGWEVNSVAARLGVSTSNRYNYSANGARMTHFQGQIRDGKSGGSGSVSPLPSGAGLVLVEMGGNDLCRDSVADMTSVASYRTQFLAGLNQISAQAPNALVQVLSVPDIYNLWYIRGAPKNSIYHPENESDQADGLNGARFYWGQSFFPCQSLLNNADSYAQADRDRRTAVRTRTKEYNTVLSEECAKILRCRFDTNRLFNLTSNRVSPPDGPLLPQASWAFTDQDISRNTAFLCPIPGLIGGGCGDHFHPSKQGQGKVADSATIASRDWTDVTYPTAGGSVLASGRPDGLHPLVATVRFTGTDGGGLRGQEVRVHKPNGSITPWAPSIGIAKDLAVADVGTSYVEVRSLDVNGNLSEGTIITVVVSSALAPTAPGTPTLSAAGAGLGLSWIATANNGGSAITGYEVIEEVGAPSPTSAAPVSVSGLSTTVTDAAAGQIVQYRVRAVNAVGASPLSAPSAKTVAPFGSLSTFVARQYQDFAGRAPTGAELLEDVAGLSAGTVTPSAFVDRLRSGTWFDGAYGPATRLYRAYFLRLPDPSGLDYWANRRREGRTIFKISQQFSESSEFLRRYGSLTNAEFIDQLYNNVFDRDPDPSGRDFYLRRLAAGWNRGQVVLQFSESSEYKRKTAGVVDIVELVRGMHGRAPGQAEVDVRLTDHLAGGSAQVFASLVSGATYRARVFG